MAKANELQAWIENAKSSGYSDAEINAQLSAYGVKPQQRGRGGTATSLISEGGALAGGATGAAIGSAVPGIGTVIGGIIGAGVGAFGGRLGENKVRDNRWGVGDALKEGVVSAGMSAISPAAKVAKGVITGGAKKAAASVVDDAVVGAVKNTPRNVIERTSDKYLGNAWNLRTGLNLNGQVLTPEKGGKVSRLISFVADELKVPKTANADTVVEYAANHRNAVGSAISSVIQKSPTAIDGASLVKKLTPQIEKVIGAGGVDNAVAKDIMTQMGKIRTPSEAWGLMKLIDDQMINWSRADTSAIPGAESIATQARKLLSGELKKSIPEYGDLAKSYRNAIDVIKLSAQGAKTPKGVKLPGILGSVNGPTTQSVNAGVGNAMRTIGKGVPAMPSNPAITGALRAGEGVALGSLVKPGDQSPQNAETTMQNTMYPINNSTIDTLSTEQPQASSPYPKENLMADIKRDPKNAQKYIEYYQMIESVYGASTNLKLNNTAVQTISDLQTGIDNLGSLEDRLMSSSANNPVVGALRSAIPFDTEANSLRAEIDRVKQVVGKALEGGVLRKEDEIKYARILPTINDTDAVARRKVQAIRADLTNKLQTYMQNQAMYSGGGTDIQAILASAM